jgi:hypothetical protein
MTDMAEIVRRQMMEARRNGLLAPDDELEDTIARIQTSAEPFPAYTPRPLTYTLPADPAPTDRDLRLFGLGVLMGLCWAGLAYLVFA